MRFFNLFISLILFSTIVSEAYATEKNINTLNIKPGKILVGGNICFNYTRTSDEQNSNEGFITKITPEGGYFLTENLAIIGGFLIAIPTGDLFETNAKMFGIGGGLRFYHRINKFHFYGGLEFGYLSVGKPEKENTLKIDLSTFDESNNDQTATIVSAPFGMLIALSETFALDIGIRIIYIIDSNDFEIIDLSFGYLGIQAFF
jgi:Outer membrane protein beta-barrel domain